MRAPQDKGATSTMVAGSYRFAASACSIAVQEISSV
jgi:hypothetical protein